jgi:riboflavin synthase
MFSGIIEEIGVVHSVKAQGDGKNITIAVSKPFAKDLALGDSIAVNGACQTVINFDTNTFQFFSSRQTLEITNLGLIQKNTNVNLEKALTLNKKLDGHLVSGHVDSLCEILKIQKQAAGYLVYFSVPKGLENYLVTKGSVALDGVSLTIYALEKGQGVVSMIPFTFEHTIFKHSGAGAKMNLETDMLGKYVVKYLEVQASAGKALDRNFLQKNGFLS